MSERSFCLLIALHNKLPGIKTSSTSTIRLLSLWISFTPGATWPSSIANLPQLHRFLLPFKYTVQRLNTNMKQSAFAEMVSQINEGTYKALQRIWFAVDDNIKIDKRLSCCLTSFLQSIQSWKEAEKLKKLKKRLRYTVYTVYSGTRTLEHGSDCTQ